MKQSTCTEMISKLSNGKTVYLLDDFYNRAFKIPPDWPELYIVKKKGGGEYQIKYDNGMVLETMEEAIEITEEEYLKY
jgi:hypothetical protein